MKHAGLLHQLKAYLEHDLGQSCAFWPDGRPEIKEILAKLDAFMADMPEGYEEAIREFDEYKKTIKWGINITRLHEAAALLNNAMKEPE